MSINNHLNDTKSIDFKNLKDSRMLSNHSGLGPQEPPPPLRLWLKNQASQDSSSHKWISICSRSQAFNSVSRKRSAQGEALNPLKCSQFKSHLKDVTEAYGHHKHNMEDHLFHDGTLPPLSVCLLWRLATHWWGIRKSLRNTNSRMAQSQPTPD